MTIHVANPSVFCLSTMGVILTPNAWTNLMRWEITRRGVAPPKASSTYDPGNTVAWNSRMNRVILDLDPREAQQQLNLDELDLPKGIDIILT